MGFRDSLTDLQMMALNVVHRVLLKLSGGANRPDDWFDAGGRAPHYHHSTGKRRSTMLTAPVHGDGRYILVASMGGNDRNPQWYLNLVANPDVELTVDGKTVPMRARTATAEEKAELWPGIVAAYRGYGGYQRKTERDIPVVVCEPRQH